MVHVSIAPGYKAIVLPNGKVYAEGEEADLTDAEFASIPPSIIGTIVLVAVGDELDNLPIDTGAVVVTGAISIPGTVTFEKNETLRSIVKNLPLETLLVETDCPYLTPNPFRGKRNEPAYVVHTARKIAEIKGKPFEEVAAVTTANAKALFGIP